MLNEKRKKTEDVVEPPGEWLQVGGPLANVIGNLQVRSRPKVVASTPVAKPAPPRQQPAGDLFAPRKAA